MASALKQQLNPALRWHGDDFGDEIGERSFLDPNGVADPQYLGEYPSWARQRIVEGAKLLRLLHCLNEPRLQSNRRVPILDDLLDAECFPDLGECHTLRIKPDEKIAAEQRTAHSLHPSSVPGAHGFHWKVGLEAFACQRLSAEALLHIASVKHEPSGIYKHGHPQLKALTGIVGGWLEMADSALHRKGLSLLFLCQIILANGFCHQLACTWVEHL
jgi:hypothetical protein